MYFTGAVQGNSAAAAAMGDRQAESTDWARQAVDVAAAEKPREVNEREKSLQKQLDDLKQLLLANSRAPPVPSGSAAAVQDAAEHSQPVAPSSEQAAVLDERAGRRIQSQARQQSRGFDRSASSSPDDTEKGAQGSKHSLRRERAHRTSTSRVMHATCSSSSSEGGTPYMVMQEKRRLQFLKEKASALMEEEMFNLRFSIKRHERKMHDRKRARRHK
eukprot:6205229-Pleurochrysis_carterae.AAC.1